jgi:RNA polymerase sigma-70 factor (ECF subfamily)
MAVMSAEGALRREAWSIGQNELTLDWEVIYAEALPRLFNFFRYRVGNDAVAEDLTSATFEKAWRKRESYRRDLAGFYTWMFAIARNIATDYFRRHKQVISLDEISSEVGHLMLISDPSDGPEEAAQKSADFNRLYSLLQKLPERDQEIVAMKYGAGFTNREIARLMNLSESNIGTLASRLVARLRSEWDQ